MYNEQIFNDVLLITNLITLCPSILNITRSIACGEMNFSFFGKIKFKAILYENVFTIII
jgi:hypothetical protein